VGIEYDIDEYRESMLCKMYAWKLSVFTIVNTGINRNNYMNLERKMLWGNSPIMIFEAVGDYSQPTKYMDKSSL